jgi:NAD-dependent deacetylase
MQNVDGLHGAAGSRDVVEVHGSLREVECLACGRRAPWPEAGVPRCDCGAIIKPGVVMFGELLPAQASGRATAVQPAASLPWETLDAGGDVAIVNLGPTAFDARATLRVDGKAGEVLRAAVERL